MTCRVRINKWILNNIKKEIQNEIINEIGTNKVPESLLINVALLRYISLRDNREIDIQIKKNGRFKFKID